MASASPGPGHLDPPPPSAESILTTQPIPLVRQTEQRLRRDVQSHREKLRVLVGGSYRDLLRTAETIVHMDSQVGKVEDLMSHTGQKCNVNVLDRKGRGLEGWNGTLRKTRSEEFTLASQLGILRACPDVIADCLRKSQSREAAGAKSLLLAAKVLVIARLLHSQSSKREADPARKKNGVPSAAAYLETLRTRLASLRRRLLSLVDKRMAYGSAASPDAESLTDAMCAFALATSSSCADVVRHFLHLRVQAILTGTSGDAQNASQKGKEEVILAGLRMYIRTREDVQRLIPAKLAQALKGLKAGPIFKNLDVARLNQLNLDIHERWIGDDMRTFTPYIRHDDLSDVEAERLQKAWAREAIGKFLQQLKGRLKQIGKAGELMRLRNECLKLWLSQRRDLSGDLSADILDQLRDSFNEQAIVLIRSTASGLQKLPALASQVLDAPSKAVNSLWSPSIVSPEAGRNTKAFRQRLVNVASGKNDAMLHFSARYVHWVQSVEGIEKVIADSRKIKWEDENDLDEDDDVLDDKQALLAQDDPRTLSEALTEALSSELSELEKSMRQFAADLDSGTHIALFLRLWREIRLHLPKAYHNPRLGMTTISDLMLKLAKISLISPMARCSKRLAKTSPASGPFPLTALWEGDPALPTLPSPWAYTVLLDVVKSMETYGADIWSLEAAGLLRTELVDALVSVLEASPVERGDRLLNGQVNGSTTDGDGDAEPNGKDASSKNEEKKEHDEETGLRDRRLQRLFDMLYLEQLKASNQDSTKGLEQLSGKLTADMLLEEKQMERMRSSAGEYWRKTSLMFGLLTS